MTTMSNKQFNSSSQTPPTLSSGGGGGGSGNCSLLTNEDYLNKKITFIQNHINNLLIEITNLPEPWSYAVTEDGRVFFINEKDRQTTWLHPKTGQPVSIMIIPPIEDLPNGWQKDYILGLPYLIDHNSKRNYPITALNKQQNDQQQQYVSDYQNSSTLNNNNYTVINNNHNSNNNYANKMSMSMIANGKSPMNNNHNQNYHNLQEQQQQQQQLLGHSNHLPADANINLTSSSCSNSSSLSNKEENSNEAAMAPMTSAAIDSALRKCGWLHKLSQNGLKLWRKRYFVLTDYILDYYSDSTRTKHCGTIFLNNTHSRPTVKKDGSSAFNRKHSFKVELVQADLNDHNNGANSNNSDNSSTGPSSNNNYIYLAADSAALMNEWINNFNFVSKMKNNSHHHRNFNEKKPSSQRSLSNTSTRTNASVNNGATLSSNNFVIKHDSLGGGGKRSSKSNSAPSSPSLNRNSLVLNDQSKKQLRSSLSSNRIEDKSNPNRKLIKKKLAFSDDEILNDVGQPQSHQQPVVNYNKNTASKSFKFNLKSKKSTASDAEINMTDYESNENLTNLNNSYHRRNESFEYNGDDRRSGSDNAVLKHKRSSSLTKAPRTNMSSSVTNGLSSARSNRSSNLIYDYRPIYEAFEKPILDMNAKQGEQQQQEQFGNGSKVMNNLIMSSSLHGSDFNRQSRFNVSYIDKEKIAAAAAAASAAAAALEKDKDRDYYSTRTAGGLLAGSLTTPNLTSNASSSSSASTSSASSSSASNSSSSSTAKNVQPIVQPTVQANNSNSTTTATANKPITNLYTLNKSQIEGLPKSEIQMLIRQLRRNFVLLNHSQQRFSLLHKLYEPYELIYQQRQSQSQIVNHKMTDDSLNMNELTMCMHDSFQTIYNRIKKIELKMDTVENCLKVAQQCETSPAPSSSSSLSSNNSQNNPTIYEDLINVENQYSQSSCLNNNNSTKFQNLLKLYEYQIVEMQHEYELLLEDKIIVDKLLDNQMRVFSNYKNLSNEKSLIQQFNALNQEMDLLQSQLLKANQLLNDTISEKCKHELIHHQQQQMMQQRANNPNNFNQTNKPTADSSNLFRANLVPVGNETSSNFTTNMHSLWRAMSPTNIKKQNLTGSSDNLANGVNLPIRNQPQVQQPQQQQQQQQNRNQPMNQYVSQVNGNVSRLNDISKSIDSIYSPSSSCSSNKTPNVTMSAFKRTTELTNNADESCNSTSSKEKEIQISFQPINFTNSRPKPAQMGGMVQNKSTNFKRDFIAEKKRSSIGKYPQNYYYQTTTKSNEYFQPIPVQHTHSQQSARERLFGNNQLSLSNNTSQQSTEADSLNSRKIALVRPEMRGSCDNDMICRFTQQNQMEYFDADYTEELVKNIQKPEVFSIPRGNIDIEPEIELTDEEKKAKERKVLEIKKMIALQSLQQMNLNDSSSYHDQGPTYLNSMYNNSNNGNSAPTTSSNIYQSSSHSQNTNNTMYTSNGLHSFDFNFEKEKKAREQLLDLRHELAEQIKEKTRQAAANSTSNGASSSLSPSSSNDLDNNNQITENGHYSSSIFVTKMAQTFDRMHANKHQHHHHHQPYHLNNSSSLNNSSLNNDNHYNNSAKSFIPIPIREKK